jgi:uncharacterized repeat protein (TIGR01451 family)
MLRTFFVASLLSVIFLGISEPAAALQTQRASRARAINPLDVQDCAAYPIALHTDSLAGRNPGDMIGDIYNGSGSGNFGWLRWPTRTSAATEEYLVESLNDATLAATDFEDACEAGDTSLNAGDCVWSNTGLSNSSDTREALTALESQDIRVPVWDTATGSGPNGYYHIDRIAGFAIVRITDFQLSSPNRITFQFVRWDSDTCLEVADLSIAKSASPGQVQPGQTLTYTLAFSNAGTGPATGVVISDALPLVLTDTHFTHSGAAITPTGGVTYAWQVQDLAPNEGGIITVTGQVRPDLAGSFTFTNSATITGTNTESDTGNNAGAAPVLVPNQMHLPIIFKQG